jgi:hypothetical protein
MWFGGRLRAGIGRRGGWLAKVQVRRLLNVCDTHYGCRDWVTFIERSRRGVFVQSVTQLGVVELFGSLQLDLGVTQLAMEALIGQQLSCRSQPKFSKVAICR